MVKRSKYADLEKIITISELFGVMTDYILKGTEPVTVANQKTVYSLYFGFTSLFAAIAGISMGCTRKIQYGKINLRFNINISLNRISEGE